MPRITLFSDRRGLPALVETFPETGKPLVALAKHLLQGPSRLTIAEREVIATWVSVGNGCAFCSQSHAKFAQELLSEGPEWRESILAGQVPPNTSRMLIALLALADQVRISGKAVTDQAIAEAREAGANDQAIHDTVLIAGFFCMVNRYVETFTDAP